MNTDLQSGNVFIVDTGAICTYLPGENVMDVLEKVLIFSASAKPSIFKTHQPTVSIQSKDLVVCNIGDIEIRVYPLPPTFEVKSEAYYLSAPFTTCLKDY